MQLSVLQLNSDTHLLLLFLNTPSFVLSWLHFILSLYFPFVMPLLSSPVCSFPEWKLIGSGFSAAVDPVRGSTNSYTAAL